MGFSGISDKPAVEISVVVPVYNSAETLEELVARLTQVLSRRGTTYELIFVDDGSRDGSWNVLARLQKTDPQHVTTIQLMRNFGQCNTVMCGFRHARGRYVVTLDDDLQNPPEEIPKLLEEICRDDSDVVYGAYIVKQHNFLRRLGSRVATAFYQWVFQNDAPVTSFRILKREVVTAILSYGLNFTYIDGLIAWNTQKIGQVHVVHEARRQGSSGYSPGKLLLAALNLMTNFSLIPLRIVSLCGMATAVCGLLSGIFYLMQYLTTDHVVPGYASTIIAVLVLGGVQLISLGVMGEYVGRLHLNMNRKPQYTIRRSQLCDEEFASFPRQLEVALLA